MSDRVPKVTVQPVGPREQWHAFCEELDCGWRQGPSEKTYVNYRARSHRAFHRTNAGRPCAATVQVQAGDQTPMDVTCWRLTGHEGKHCANTLDESGKVTPNRHEWSDHD
jgi:hypothetical protein